MYGEKLIIMYALVRCANCTSERRDIFVIDRVPEFKSPRVDMFPDTQIFRLEETRGKIVE